MVLILINMLHLFVGVAPIENPQVVVLVTLYNPTGEGGHQGGVWFI